jgi:hypothetical protein
MLPCAFVSLYTSYEDKKSIRNPTKETDVEEDVGYESSREAPGLKVVEEEAEEVEEEAHQRHRHGAHRRCHQAHALKGQCHEIFDFWFFHESVSPKPVSVPLGPFRIFLKIRGDIRKSRCTTDGKIATGINNTSETGGKICSRCR